MNLLKMDSQAAVAQRVMATLSRHVALSKTCLQQKAGFAGAGVKACKPGGSARSYNARLDASVGGRKWVREAVAPAQPQVFADEEGVDEQVWVIAVVGSGSMSPWGKASWKEVLEQMARKLEREDDRFRMLVFEDGNLPSSQFQTAVEAAQVCVAVGVQADASARWVGDQTSHMPTLVAFQSHEQLKCRVGGCHVPAQGPLGALQAAMPMSRSRQAAKRIHQLSQVWERASSDNILFALLLIIDTYVTPVKSLAKLQARSWASLQCMMRKCGRQALACLMDPKCRLALNCMGKCDPRDVFCCYKCIVTYENPVLEAFSLCAIQQHNCLGLCAAMPPQISPMRTFRGAPLTHSQANNILVGWLPRLGWSWRIAASMLATAADFSCQHQIFYQDGDGCMWYDPVFLTRSHDGTAVWRRRHYFVEPAEEPGSFSFSVLDNGVVAKEVWTMVDVAARLEWALFYYVGAAERAGQVFTGVLLVTPDGKWPGEEHMQRMVSALDRCEIKAWELVTIEHSSKHVPQLELPDHVPQQLGIV